MTSVPAPRGKFASVYERFRPLNRLGAHLRFGDQAVARSAVIRCGVDVRNRLSSERGASVEEPRVPCSAGAHAEVLRQFCTPP